MIASKQLMNDESILASKMQSNLTNDFFIKAEVEGRSLIDGASTRIDFMMYPRPSLVSCGFPEVYFGVEVKHIMDPVAEHWGRAARMFWQAITYQQSIFHIKDRDVRPSFVLIYSNLNGLDIPRLPSQPNWFAAYLQMANLGMVGRLLITNNESWSIGFVSSTIFSKSNGVYRKHKSGGVGFGSYIGNSTRKRDR